MRRRLGAALAGLALCASPAAAQPDPAWEAGLGHAVRAFDGAPAGWSAWRETSAFLRRRLESGSLGAEAVRAERFDAADLGVAADAWVGLGPRAYGEFRIDLAPDAEILPEYGVRAEAYVAPVDGWEVSAGWRRSGFDGRGVDEAVASIAEYVGRWYLRQRVTALFGAGEDGALAVDLVARRTLATPRDLVEAGAALGPIATVVGRGPLVEASDRRSVWVRFEAFPWPRLGFAARGEASWFDPPVPDRRVASAAVLTRW